MKIDPSSRGGSLLLTIAGHMVRWLLVAIGTTLRLEIVEGRERLAELESAGQPVILSFWHDRTFLAAHFMLRHLLRRDFHITLLASQSRDGEMVTRMAKTWGLDTVRGSATRGGRQALRAIHRAVTKRGSSPIMIPDGPHGPQYVFKVGVAVLAQTTGAPILPLGFAARSAWHLKSWDRLIIPKPFTRVKVVIGEPQPVDPALTGDQLELERQRLEAVINGVTNQARESCA